MRAVRGTATSSCFTMARQSLKACGIFRSRVIFCVCDRTSVALSRYSPDDLCEISPAERNHIEASATESRHLRPHAPACTYDADTQRHAEGATECCAADWPDSS